MRILGWNRARSLWHMILAPTVWALHFCVTYAMTAIVCAKGGDVATLRWAILVVTLIATAIILVLAWYAWRQWDYTDDWDYEHNEQTVEARREFLGHIGFLLAVVSLIGVIYVALPAAFIGSCL